VRVRRAQRGLAARWVEMTRENAANALRMRIARREGWEELYADLAALLGTAAPPARLECFDISHTQGEGTVASCVVFGPEGPLKKEYRRFNISGAAPGDDYAALRQALERRYTRVRDGEVPPPDLLVVDGGPAQVAGVADVLEALGFGQLSLLGISKGPDRRAGQERLHHRPSPAACATLQRVGAGDRGRPRPGEAARAAAALRRSAGGAARRTRRPRAGAGHRTRARAKPL
jgi:excinuclease ABC subunit C